MGWRDIGAVVIGAVIGTGARLGLDTALPHSTGDFPLSTFLINLVGAFLLGTLVSSLWGRVPSWVRAGLGAGLLGSFTTFSALIVSLVDETAGGYLPLAVLYLVLSLVLGFGAAALGLRVGSRSARAAHTSDASDTSDIDEADE